MERFHCTMSVCVTFMSITPINDRVEVPPRKPKSLHGHPRVPKTKFGGMSLNFSSSEERKSPGLSFVHG